MRSRPEVAAQFEYAWGTKRLILTETGLPTKQEHGWSLTSADVIFSSLIIFHRLKR